MTEVRPLLPADVEAAEAVAFSALSDMAAVYEGEPFPPRTEEGAQRARYRVAHLQRTDPDGAWVAVDGDAVVGIALSLRRGSMWFLSLLAVDTSQQAKGVGRLLLDAALQTSAGADAAWILATADPKALRRYALAGFAPHAGYLAKGPLDRSLVPAVAVATGDWAVHGGLVDAVVTYLRGAPYGPDLGAFEAVGNRLLVVDEPAHRGFCIVGPRGIASVGATSPDVAQRLLWAALAETADPVGTIDWLTADQQWAIDVALAARLPLTAGASSCRRSALGPLSPFLPNGAYG